MLKGLRALEAAGQGLCAAGIKTGQKKRGGQIGRFRTFVPVDMQAFIHSAHGFVCQTLFCWRYRGREIDPALTWSESAKIFCLSQCHSFSSLQDLSRRGVAGGVVAALKRFIRFTNKSLYTE